MWEMNAGCDFAYGTQAIIKARDGGFRVHACPWDGGKCGQTRSKPMAGYGGIMAGIYQKGVISTARFAGMILIRSLQGNGRAKLFEGCPNMASFLLK
jgi:hypothetical protein